MILFSALKAGGNFWGLTALKAGGTLLSILLESRRNYILFSKGIKGFAFGNGIMSYADGTGEGPSLAEGPSPEGPLARWYKPQLVLNR